MLIQERHAAEMLARKTQVFISLLCITAIGVFSGSSWILSAYHDSFPQNSSLCACHKCLTEYDPWFSELMNASPEPFLSTKNNISADTFKWWKRLQLERRSFSFYNKTVENVFQMFPPSPDLTEPSTDRCRTCAVVGNSGNLKGSHYGPLIDFHDVIISLNADVETMGEIQTLDFPKTPKIKIPSNPQMYPSATYKGMNKGRTKGFEKDVGTKTTHHVMYPHSSTNLDNTTHLVLFPFKISDLQWLFNSFTPRQKTTADSELKANKDLVMILSPAFMRYVHYVWLKRKGMYPSTGFLTLILSMHMCDEISVFGFGADRAGNWNHYYEIIKNKRLRTGNHPGNNEYKIIQQLYQQQKIRFFKGW